MPKEKLDIYQWLKMSQDQVLNKFHCVPTAFSNGKGNKRFVYIKGKREDKALIVAHADTVWNNESIDFEVIDGKVTSTNKHCEHKTTHNGYECTTFSGRGIGADDRAGCSIAWDFIDSGHSVLITSGEEIGCIASKRMMRWKWWQDEIAKHSFAVQFDRRNGNDIVFYDVGTTPFVDYVHEQTKYQPDSGFGTDIKFLCRDICGVNMSVGYYNEHKSDETLVLKEYERTLETAKNWLGQKLPRFENALGIKDRFYYYGSKYAPKQDYSNNWSGHSGWHEYEAENGLGAPTSGNEIIPFKPDPPKAEIVCKYCSTINPQEEWFENHLCCSLCKKEI